MVILAIGAVAALLHPVVAHAALRAPYPGHSAFVAALVVGIWMLDGWEVSASTAVEATGAASAGIGGLVGEGLLDAVVATAAVTANDAATDDANHRTRRRFVGVLTLGRLRRKSSVGRRRHVDRVREGEGRGGRRANRSELRLLLGLDAHGVEPRVLAIALGGVAVQPVFKGGELASGDRFVGAAAHERGAHERERERQRAGPSQRGRAGSHDLMSVGPR